MKTFQGLLDTRCESWGTQSRDPKHPHVTPLLKWMDRGQVIHGVWTQVWLLVGHWLHRLTCWSFPWFSEDWLEQLYLGTGDNHTGSLSCVVWAGRENQVDDWNHLTLPSEDFKSKTIRGVWQVIVLPHTEISRNSSLYHMPFPSISVLPIKTRSILEDSSGLP